MWWLLSACDKGFSASHAFYLLAIGYVANIIVY